MGGSHRGIRKLLRESLAVVSDEGYDSLLTKYPCPTVGNPSVFNYQGFRFTYTWLKLLDKIGLAGFSRRHIEDYGIELPDSVSKEDAHICAHPNVFQHFSALAERAMDGAKLYFYLKDNPTSTQSTLDLKDINDGASSGHPGQ